MYVYVHVSDKLQSCLDVAVNAARSVESIETRAHVVCALAPIHVPTLHLRHRLVAACVVVALRTQRRTQTSLAVARARPARDGLHG